ncbi:MAG: hypothetical protein WAU86_22150 [Oricola sp.]
MISPEHMNKGVRNLRLYETLKGMGLYVVPIPDENDPDVIAQIVVSAELPFAQRAAEKPTESGVSGTVERAEVGKVVGSTDSSGVNVIDFPTVGR